MAHSPPPSGPDGSRKGPVRQPARFVIRLLGTLSGVVTTILLVLYFDLRQVFLPLLDSDLRLLLGTMLLQSVHFLLLALAPTVLLGSATREPLSRLHIAGAFLAVQPIAQLTPGRLGELGAIPLLKTHYKPGAIASSLFLSKAISVLVSIVSLPIALAVVTRQFPSPRLVAWLLVAAAATLASPIVFVSPRVRRLANEIILRRWPELLEGFGAHLIFLFSRSPGSLVLSLLLTLAKMLDTALVIALLSANYGVAAPFVACVCGAVLVQAVGLLPISVMNIGLAEASLVGTFAVFGLQEAAALNVIIFGRFLGLLVVAAIYFFVTLPFISRRVGGKQ